MIKVQCNGCSHPWSVPEAFAGKRVRCKRCHAVISIPDGRAPGDVPAAEEVTADAARGFGLTQNEAMREPDAVPPRDAAAPRRAMPTAEAPQPREPGRKVKTERRSDVRSRGKLPLIFGGVIAAAALTAAGLYLGGVLDGGKATKRHPWDAEEGLAFSSEQLLERGALDLSGKVVVLMTMGSLFGPGGASMSSMVQFTTDAGRKYELMVFEDTRFVGIARSPEGVVWALGKRYQILGIPEGDTFLAVRVKLSDGAQSGTL